MTLKDILVISGQSGLFKFVLKSRNHVIAESLSDGKRTTIPASMKISVLEEIAVFTKDKEILLREIFFRMQRKEEGGAAISHKSSDAELKRYFTEVVPEYDTHRVYLSDIRKIVMWYNMLLEFGITDFEMPTEETTTEVSTE